MQPRPRRNGNLELASGMTDLAVDRNETGELRVRLTRLRQELTATTQAYRSAVARHDSQGAIPLLRTRSRLMRQLLETQCELLLKLKAENVQSDAISHGSGSAAPALQASILA
jgi:small-conductance mechanosensitive channel